MHSLILDLVHHQFAFGSVLKYLFKGIQKERRLRNNLVKNVKKVYKSIVQSYFQGIPPTNWAIHPTKKQTYATTFYTHQNPSKQLGLNNYA